MSEHQAETDFGDGSLIYGDVGPFPQAGDNFATLPRSEIYSLIGLLETIADLPERSDTDFTLQADYQNYLSGRTATQNA